MCIVQHGTTDYAILESRPRSWIFWAIEASCIGQYRVLRSWIYPYMLHQLWAASQLSRICGEFSSVFFHLVFQSQKGIPTPHIACKSEGVNLPEDSQHRALSPLKLLCPSFEVNMDGGENETKHIINLWAGKRKPNKSDKNSQTKGNGSPTVPELPPPHQPTNPRERISRAHCRNTLTIVFVSYVHFGLIYL